MPRTVTLAPVCDLNESVVAGTTAAALRQCMATQQATVLPMAVLQTPAAVAVGAC